MSFSLDLSFLQKQMAKKRIAVLKSLGLIRVSTPVPVVKRILPPRHYHINWPATRARHFARIVSGNPKTRGTYDQNIRLLNALYMQMIGLPQATEEADVRLFIQKCNPLAFAHTVGIHPLLTKKLLGHSFPELLHRITHSKCECCRALAPSLI